MFYIYPKLAESHFDRRKNGFRSFTSLYVAGEMDLIMAVSLIRTIILYFLIIIALRGMGKRTIGELQPAELVVTILISELAAIPMQDSAIPIIYGIIPILTLLSCELLISYVSLKNLKIRMLLEGRPSIIINKGIIDQQEMSRLRYTIDDLTEELRLNGVASPDLVYTAIMETNGKLSVFLKSDYAPPPANAMNVKAEEAQIPVSLISDGRLITENLASAKVTEQWVIDELLNNKISDIKHVFFMCIDSNRKTLIIPKENYDS